MWKSLIEIRSRANEKDDEEILRVFFNISTHREQQEKDDDDDGLNGTI